MYSALNRHSVAMLFSPSRKIIKGRASLTERMLQARALRREQLRAVCSDVHVVFQTHAELAANVNPRFIAEAHAGLQPQSVAAHQVRPLVAIHADAVSEPVS